MVFISRYCHIRLCHFALLDHSAQNVSMEITKLIKMSDNNRTESVTVSGQISMHILMQKNL